MIELFPNSSIFQWMVFCARVCGPRILYINIYYVYVQRRTFWLCISNFDEAFRRDRRICVGKTVSYMKMIVLHYCYRPRLVQLVSYHFVYRISYLVYITCRLRKRWNIIVRTRSIGTWAPTSQTRRRRVILGTSTYRIRITRCKKVRFCVMKKKEKKIVDVRDRVLEWRLRNDWGHSIKIYSERIINRRIMLS